MKQYLKPLRSITGVFLVFLLLCAFFAADIAISDELSPDLMVKNVTNEVLDIIRKDKDIQSGNTRKASELIEAKVLPNFDFNRMTALAVGKDWRGATVEQKKVLIEEFHTLLVHTYANALTAYKSQTINFKPFKMAAGETDVTVKTEVKRPGAKPISIDYSLQKDGGTWKVYDVIVGGVSLVTSYRDQFKQEIAASGIDSLIKSLQNKNQSANSAKK